MEAPDLFYTEDAEAQTLHRRIIPSATQQDFQQERWKALADFLVDRMGEKVSVTPNTWLQGSYKFGTQIRPKDKFGEFDIDLALIFKWEGGAAEGPFSAVELKSILNEVLQEYAEDEEEVVEVEQNKTRCSRIRFEGGFHIDVPIYHESDEADELVLATEKNEWERSDPKQFYEWFQSEFPQEQRDKVRRQIRYLKMWSRLAFEDAEECPSSVLLTVLVSEIFSEIAWWEVLSEDAMFRSLADGVMERLTENSEVLNPVNTEENLNRLSEEGTGVLIERLQNLSDIAERALSAESKLETACIWQEAFAHFVELPANESQEETGTALVPVISPEVYIRAVGIKNPNINISGKNEIRRVPKGCRISFVLANPEDFPEGYRVEWVVRNKEEEAELENDLGHLAGSGNEGEEHSAYVGVHYMDVIIKDMFGLVIGFRRIPVEIIGVPAVPRNPKKPGYKNIPRSRR